MQDDPNLVKDLLNHVRKNGFKGAEATKGGGGKKGKKGKKAAKEQVADESGSDDGNIEALLAAMNQGSDSE